MQAMPTMNPTASPTLTTAADAGAHPDGGMVISDLRGGVARDRGVSALGVLEDPTGRRARVMRRAAIAVGVLFSSWLVGLMLCGLGLLPSGSLPLSSGLAASNGPPPIPDRGLQRAGAASDNDGRASLAVAPGGRQAAVAPSRPDRTLEEQRSSRAPRSRAAIGPTGAPATGGRSSPGASTAPASPPGGGSQPAFAAPPGPGAAGQTPVATGTLPPPATAPTPPGKGTSHPAHPATGTSHGSSGSAPGQVLTPGQRGICCMPARAPRLASTPR